MKANSIIAAGHIDPTRAYSNFAYNQIFGHYQSTLLASYESQGPFMF